MRVSLFDTIREIVLNNDCVGGVIILQKRNDKGQNIAQFNLTHSEIRECLAIANYYNEKIELEKN